LSDYCNSILIAGLPACRLVPLQRVQNAAARLVLNLDQRAHISPALQQLHWLPVKHHITFKIATLMHQILQKRCSSYFADVVTRERTIRALTDTIRYEYSSVYNGRYRYRYEYMYSLCHGVPATYIIRTGRSLRERRLYAMGGTLHPRLNNADH